MCGWASSLGNRASNPAKEWRIALADAARDADVSPLEVLLITMRQHWAEAERYRQASETASLDGEVDEAEEWNQKKLAALGAACDYAIQAAPYCHPRLSSQNVKVEGLAYAPKSTPIDIPVAAREPIPNSLDASTRAANGGCIETLGR